MRRQILAWREQGAAAEAARLQADIAALQEKIGNALNVQKHFAAAVPHYEAALACHKRWAMAEPDNLTKQRNLLIMLNKSGDALIASDNPALAAFRPHVRSFRGCLSERPRMQNGNALRQSFMAASVQPKPPRRNTSMRMRR